MNHEKDLFSLSYMTPTFVEKDEETGEESGPGILATPLYRIRATNRLVESPNGKPCYEIFIQFQLDSRDEGPAKSACTAQEILDKIQDHKGNGSGEVIGDLSPELRDALSGYYLGRKTVDGNGKHIVPFETFMPRYDSSSWRRASDGGGYRRREFNFSMLERVMNGETIPTAQSLFGARGVNKVPVQVKKNGKTQVLWLPQDLLIYQFPEFPSGKALENCKPGEVPIIKMGFIAFLGHEGEETIFGNIQIVVDWMRHEDNIPADMAKYTRNPTTSTDRSNEIDRTMNQHNRNRRNRHMDRRVQEVLSNDTVPPISNAGAEAAADKGNDSSQKPAAKKRDRASAKTKKSSRRASR